MIAATVYPWPPALLVIAVIAALCLAAFLVDLASHRMRQRRLRRAEEERQRDVSRRLGNVIKGPGWRSEPPPGGGLAA